MTQIKLRRDTSANFTSKNPVLGVGEPAYETDTKKLKIGDGTTAYTQLEYFSSGGGGTGDIPIATTTTAGKVKPDGTTITITDDGTISAVDDGGLELCDTDIVIRDDEKMFTQLQQMRRSTFDLSKFTVVGSPTITDDGVVSGFSKNDYIITPKIDYSNANSWEIYTQKFSVSSMQNLDTILCNNTDTNGADGIAIFIRANGQTSWCVQSELGTNIFKQNANTNIQINTEYQFKLEFTGSAYNLYLSTNGGSFMLVDTYTSSTKANINISIAIGRGLGQYWKGNPIDLKQFSITVDGKEVFSGNKTGLDVIKADSYEVVGSPTISVDGVASGFSGSNYIKTLNQTINTYSTFKICGKFHTPVSDLTTYNPLIYYSTTNGSTIFIRIQDNNNKIYIAFGNDGYNIEQGSTSIDPALSLNTNYYYEFLYDGTSYKFNISTDGINFTTIYSKVSNEKIIIPIIILGRMNNSRYFEGSIDLNSFKIYVDGNLVYQPCLKIPYTQSKTGSKIVDEIYRDRVIDLYEQEGQARYYTIDEPNQNFTLPMGEIYGMIGGSSSTGGSGLEICDIGMALYIDETKGLRRYLNGQILDRNKKTEAFFTRLKEITTLHPSLLDTEENWQAAKTLSPFGQVGKFVFNYSGGKIVSVRLPRVVNVQGLFDLQNLGMTVGAGLPNVTDKLINHFRENSLQPALTPSGKAFYTKTPNNGVKTSYPNAAPASAGNYTGDNVMGFDLSRGNSVYGNSDTVQQEAIQYPYFIQIATGSETENNIINDIELNNPYSLFDSKYSDHELNNLSWLKSEGQWNAKSVYPTAYDKLLKVYNGTETVEGLSVKLSTEEYTDYDFVLNTADETFRLPLKTLHSDDTVDSLSLYFYVGETVQNANLIDAGRIGEQLADKQDKLSRYPIEISDKSLMPSWYVVYSDGWCEQGGEYPSGSELLVTINLLKSFKDKNYSLISQISNQTSVTSSSPAQYRFTGGVLKLSANQFKMMRSDFARIWYACGYVS